MEGDPGLGSRALRSRKRERSVIVPRRPPRVLSGDVEARHGTPASRRGSPAARARSEANAASFKPAWTRCRDNWPSDRGAAEDREGRCRNGRRNVRKENFGGRALDLCQLISI